MTENNKMLPVSNLSQELVNILTNGIPAAIDGDGTEEGMLSALLDSSFGLSVRFGKRAELLRRWLELPSVTLEQAAWLLLGRDPFDAQGNEPEPPDSFLASRYHTLLNLLECEVAEQRLRPVGKYVPGFLRRFRLTGVATACKRINMAISVIEHLDLLVAEKSLASPPESLAYQTERIQKRMQVHKALVDRIRETNPAAVTALEPETRRDQRRRFAHEPLNVRLAIREGQYIELFRGMYPTICGGEPEYDISDRSLVDDRKGLNIKFHRGRPRGSKTAKRRP